MNTSLIYIEKDEKYLLMYRNKKKNDVNEGKWIGVGGKFEKHESPEECAKREAEEETGLLIEPIFRGVVTFAYNDCEAEQMFLFTARKFSGELKESCEGELEWVDKKKILSLPLWEGDKIFLKLLAEDAPPFLLKLCYRDDELVSACLNGKIIK